MPSSPQKLIPSLMQPGVFERIVGKLDKPGADTGIVPANVLGAYQYYTQAVGRYLPVQITHAKAASKRLLSRVR